MEHLTTVADLIRELKKYPATMPVVTPGFDESGYDYADIKEVIKIRFYKLLLDAKWEHSGKFEADESGEPALVISMSSYEII